MSNASHKKIYYSLGSVVVLVTLVALIWQFGIRPSRSASASDLNLRDLPDSMDAPSVSQVRRPVLPLASIPWKRGDDSFAAIFVGRAQLPWVRQVGTPTPVYLELGDLPWRH